MFALKIQMDSELLMTRHLIKGLPKQAQDSKNNQTFFSKQ